MVIRLPKNSPFVTSLVLHAAALVVLVFFVLVDFFRPKKSVHVFEMVSLPESQAVQDRPPVQVPPKLDLPELKPMPVKPQPQSQPRPKPKPREIINISDFRKKNPLPKPRPVQPVVRPPVSVPTLRVPDAETPQARTPSRELSPQQINALANYNARLRQRLDAAWKKPANMGGVPLGLTAIFQVSASGNISQIRFSPGSGNAAFDASVLAALRSVINAGPTPTGQSHTFSMKFSQD